MIQIYHNPRCGKSRACLALVQTKYKNIEVILYLQNPLTVQELQVLLLKLNLEAKHLVRTKEKIWIEHYKNKNGSNLEIIEIITNNPILLERPLVVIDDKAIIGRELENVANFIK